MTVETSQAQTSEGLAMGYQQKPDANSLAAGNLPPASQQGDRPAWLPENFKSPEDLAKSYKELQGQNTKIAQELASIKKGGDNKNTDGEVEQKLTQAGVPAESLSKWSEEFWSTGQVPPEAYDELAKVGITKDIIDDYAATRSQLVEGQRQTLMNAGGGEDNVQRIFEWASTNLSPEEVNFFNNAFDSGDLNSSMVAMETLRTKYEGAEGFSGNRVGGGNVPSAGGDVFTSTAQVVEAMSDRRYANDPAYRAQVEQKIARSKVL